jgi:hypothetical protein
MIELINKIINYISNNLFFQVFLLAMLIFLVTHLLLISNKKFFLNYLFLFILSSIAVELTYLFYDLTLDIYEIVYNSNYFEFLFNFLSNLISYIPLFLFVMNIITILHFLVLFIILIFIYSLVFNLIVYFHYILFKD